MSNFDYAIPFILEHEGGYCDISGDPGGETKYGITKRNYPNLDIKNLTKTSAINIYRADYWKSYMDEMPFPVAAKLFDMTVNMGASQANKILQRALGCDDDGVIGEITLGRVKSITPSELVVGMVYFQKEFYSNLALKKPSMQKFLKGWLKRAGWIPLDIPS